jgi:glutamate-1-semialdehyde 2,1-aminomutase
MSALGEASGDDVGTRLEPRSAGHASLVGRLRELVPGGTFNSAPFDPARGFIAERGTGAYLEDVDGRRFLDLVLGGGPLVLGHAHPRILDAVARAAAGGTQTFAPNRRALELVGRIVDLVPSAEMVRFTASGSEATFHALRLARAVTGRRGYVKFDGAYHGHHDLGVWSFEHSETHPPEGVPESAGIQAGVGQDVAVLPFNDPVAIADLLDAHPDRYAAVICEPLQRAIAPVPGFLDAVRAACDRTGTVLVFDEVVTGFRLAPGGAQERYGVLPDLTALGKALAGGVPLAALAGRRRLMEHLDPASPPEQRSYQCGTFNGYQLGVECAHATMDVLVDEGGIARLEAVGEAMAEAVRGAFDDAGVDASVVAVGGIFQPYFATGPIRDAADVRESDLAAARVFHERLLEAGVYKIAAKGYVSLAHGDDQVDELRAAARWALGRLREA